MEEFDPANSYWYYLYTEQSLKYIIKIIKLIHSLPSILHTILFPFNILQHLQRIQLQTRTVIKSPLIKIHSQQTKHQNRDPNNEEKF